MKIIACIIAPCILALGCARQSEEVNSAKTTTEANDDKATAIKHQIEKTKFLMSVAEDSVELCWSQYGAWVPVNPLDNPKGGVERLYNIVGHQSESAAFHEACGFLPPNILLYLISQLPKEKQYFPYIDELYDPFSPDGMPFYCYSGIYYNGIWHLSSVGPDRKRDILCEEILWKEDPLTGRNYIHFSNIDHIYDPTNGLMSTGDIVNRFCSDPFYDPSATRINEYFESIKPREKE